MRKAGILEDHPIQNPKSKIQNSPAPSTPPRTPQQREQDNREAQRGPFYASLRHNGDALLAAFQPASDDAATLELYAYRDDSQIVLQMVTLASRADAYHYGFRHIRLYLPNATRRSGTFPARCGSHSGCKWRLADFSEMTLLILRFYATR